ncbi:hypothetical protein MHA02_25070 [Methylobacterium haplocladii]|uniref:Uncharacterized protein n=1 Tax=Methylobacterium haplocladii TaxID=1176176 RepID=A0A512IQZ4_9HYPH|nr:hypothetical protein MHA02_25070 [Methylobacterium haplocladii]
MIVAMRTILSPERRDVAIVIDLRSPNDAEAERANLSGKPREIATKIRKIFASR